MLFKSFFGFLYIFWGPWCCDPKNLQHKLCETRFLIVFVYKIFKQSYYEMTLRIRALVFSTFFGSCIAIGLLLVSLTTNSWVKATPKKRNSAVSKIEKKNWIKIAIGITTNIFSSRWFCLLFLLLRF